jgi:predicted dehydrogenase
MMQFGAGPLERAREPDADIEQLKSEIFGKFIEVHRPVVVTCDQLTEELRAFTHCIRTRQAPRVSGEAALEAMLVARRILDRAAVAPWARPLADSPSVHRLAG